MNTATAWHWVGASVCGPAHRVMGLPNQDAWAGRRLHGASVVVMCDGLGSRNAAHIGAQAGCRAAIEAAQIWARQPLAPVELLLRLVHDIWMVVIHPNTRDSCATTCLIVVACDDGRLVAAKLGDGVIAVRAGASRFAAVSTDRGDEFANQTTGLGVAVSLKDWQWQEWRVGPDVCVFMATDGIAEDIVPEKQEAFFEFAAQTYRTIPPARGRRRLARDLRAWPVPLHADDKTAVVFWTDTKESA